MIRPLRMVLLAALLAIATLASYAPAFRAGFVDIDDPDFVTENRIVARGFTAEGVAAAFREAHAGNWFPLTWLSHMARRRVLRARAGPAPRDERRAPRRERAAPLRRVRRASPARSRRASRGRVFALHPVQVESVAWISQRKTALEHVFGILALGCCARWRAAAARARRGRSRASRRFALSLLAKQMLVTLPFALLAARLLAARRLGRDGRALDPAALRAALAEKPPFLALARSAAPGPSLAQRARRSRSPAGRFRSRSGSRTSRLPTSLRRQFFWPAGFALFYPLIPRSRASRSRSPPRRCARGRRRARARGPRAGRTSRSAGSGSSACWFR